MQEVYNITSVLDIILKVTNKNLNILAHSYLLKDKSIVSKWKSGKAVPRNYDIQKIVEFVVNECTLSQQKVIRGMIEKLIESEPAINNEICGIIFSNSDFSEFLREALSMAISFDNGYLKHENIQKAQTPENNCIAGFIKEQDGRYKGKLEFDLVLSQEDGSKSMRLYSESGMELKGNLKVTSKDSLIKAAKYAKKASSLGAVFLLIVTGVIIATSFNDTQDKELTVLGHKNGENPDVTAVVSAVKPTLKPSPTTTPILKPSPITTPINTPLTSYIPALPKSAGTQVKPTERAYENKGKGRNKNTTTVTKNVSQQNTIISSGDNSIILMGDQSSISIEKD